MDRRHLLKNSLPVLSAWAPPARTAAAQTARVPLMDRPPGAGADPGTCRPHLRHQVLPQAVPYQGPQSQVEQIGDATVIHNYGHYGSGWCLSWGSADMQVQKAMSLSPKKIAVIGSGIIGLTSALVALRAGAQVTIYTRELLPRTRSYRANGVWGPGTVALASEAPAQSGRHLGADGPHLLEEFAPLYGHGGQPHCLGRSLYPFRHAIRCAAAAAAAHGQRRGAARILQHGRPVQRPGRQAPSADARKSIPSRCKYANRATKMFFNFSEYGYLLTSEFFDRGGKIVIRDFHSPDELAHLPEKVIINCPGYAAHDWWKDKAMIPVRGQTEWLIPQPEVNYGLTYRNVEARSKSDGVMVIAIGAGAVRPKLEQRQRGARPRGGRRRGARDPGADVAHAGTAGLREADR